MKKYSVLMAVYKKDNPEYFAIALDSMINQTVPPDEIVIVKDGPITKELQAVINQRKSGAVQLNEVALEKNQGVGVARNKGLNLCRNELVAVMDSDDYSIPQRCELQLEEFNKAPNLDVIGSPVKEFLGNMGNIVSERRVPVTNEDIYKYARKRDPFNHPTVMYKRDTVIRCGGYKNYRRNIDTDLWIRLLSNGAVCKNVEKALVLFRFDDGAYRRRKSWDNTKTLLTIRFNAWQNGFNSFFDFFCIAALQVSIYVTPECFQKYIYTHYLRRDVNFDFWSK